MIWGMVVSTGLLLIEFLSGIVNSEKYIGILTEAKAILDMNFSEENYVFQQDNCSVKRLRRPKNGCRTQI